MVTPPINREAVSLRLSRLQNPFAFFLKTLALRLPLRKFWQNGQLSVSVRNPPLSRLSEREGNRLERPKVEKRPSPPKTGMITKVLARITPPCKDVTQLVSQSLDRSLPWPIKIELQLHFWICEACAGYRDQLKMIRHLLQRSAEQGQLSYSSSPSPVDKTRLTEAFRARQR